MPRKLEVHEDHVFLGLHTDTLIVARKKTVLGLKRSLSILRAPTNVGPPRAMGRMACFAVLLGTSVKGESCDTGNSMFGRPPTRGPSSSPPLGRGHQSGGLRAVHPIVCDGNGKDNAAPEPGMAFKVSAKRLCQDWTLPCLCRLLQAIGPTWGTFQAVLFGCRTQERTINEARRAEGKTSSLEASTFPFEAE